MKISFKCNICCEDNFMADVELLNREFTLCTKCGSSPRSRAMVHILSTELFGHSIPLPDFPHKPNIKGIGLSDWEGFAKPLSLKIGYTNTYYHQEPKLDISNINENYKGKYDFIICSDVFEHVLPPVSIAFKNCYNILKKNGLLIFSVPYNLEKETKEHFPNLYKFEISERQGKKYLNNITRDGIEEEYDNLIFHGGDGATLEMRMFSENPLMREIYQAGFNEVKMYRMYLRYGIYWPEPIAFPMAIIKGEGFQLLKLSDGRKTRVENMVFDYISKIFDFF
ncbi:Methyltransferase domain protein [uncultured archaeon]|nr:Methyltransferase domain protein [uncultured archaeon]